MTNSVLLELRNVSKSFGAVQALTDVDFTVREGEVMALVGDNGAGKSTLIKGIAGAHTFEKGEIYFDNKRVTISGPRDTAALGIEVVYQDLALADNLDVVANMFLGRERTRFGEGTAVRKIIDALLFIPRLLRMVISFILDGLDKVLTLIIDAYRGAIKSTPGAVYSILNILSFPFAATRWLIRTIREVAAVRKFFFSVVEEASMEQSSLGTLDSLSVTTIRSVRQAVAGLSGGQRQAIAVAKAVMWNSRLVILDEPTAALGVAQTRQVLDLVRRLADRGLGVILISHNLHDIFEVADRITVLRLGQNVAEFEASETTQQEIVHAITAGTLDEVPGMREAVA